MTYNLHPIFVHFPIALLFIYSIIRILPLDRWIKGVSWKDVRVIVLVLGVLGAFASLATGETAEHMIQANHQLVETHAFFASSATWLYVILLIGEVAIVANRRFVGLLSKYSFVLKISRWCEKILANNIVAIILSLLALASITLAGMLGGAIVYGTTADPLAGFVLNLLGISL